MAEKQNWSKMVGVRLDAKTLYLVEIARLATGKEFDTLTDYIKWALEVSFKQVKIEDAQEGSDSKTIPGKTLAELADELYAGNEADRFVTLVKKAPWLVSDGESRLLSVIRHSDYYSPENKGHRVLLVDRIREHWKLLAAIRDGEANIDILPIEHRPSATFAFGLMSEAERVALYKSDNPRYKRESAAYAKAMKGKMK